MAKDRSMNSSPFDRAIMSPSTCSSTKNAHGKSCDASSTSNAGDEREWEETRCPICMEHPHNSILLLCSSRDQGCRAFICDTSYRHSNCFDLFCKSSGASYSQSPQGQQPELFCPLCRGSVSGWEVIQPARKFMDSKIRSCSLETCNFTGNYNELRNHARLEHPFSRPSEASPTRQSNWQIMEQQQEMEVDVLDYESDTIEYDWDVFWSDSDMDDMIIGLPLSLFNLCTFLMDEEPMASDISDDRLDNTAVSRYANQSVNSLPISRSAYRRENGADNSRPISGSTYENDADNSRYDRENGSTSSRFGYRRPPPAIRRADREYESSISRSRLSNHRVGRYAATADFSTTRIRRQRHPSSRRLQE